MIHYAVKNALIKSGWEITADQYTIEFKDSKVFADLAAELPIAAELGERKIVVEVKSFLGPSPMRELESAIGQYRIYRCFMRVVAPDRKLYIGISDQAESVFFRKLSIQFIVRQEKLPLLIVNTKTEEIVKWIN
ncbi:MAG: element excision factor XisH family protein [Blastocatellia bacterium]